MTDGRSRHAEFRSEVLARCQFLEERGFRRAKELEEHGSVGSSVVYMGRAVGFTFYLDVREMYVGVEVFSIVGGQKCSDRDGGYSADLWQFLVKHAGYRGSVGALGPTMGHPPCRVHP